MFVGEAMHPPFWFTFGILSPVAIPLALYTRRTVVRLPEADGEPLGQWGHGAPAHRLLVVGESTAAGVGVLHHHQGLASQLALQLHQQSGQAVAWHTFGVNGIRVEELLARLADTALPPVDQIFISMGVNDTTGFTSRRRYRIGLLQLIEALSKQHPHIRITLLAVPPMHKFTALPILLRQLLGWRARQLDQQHRRVARNVSLARYLDYPALQDPALLAKDGYHPNASGYRAMAAALTEQKSSKQKT